MMYALRKELEQGKRALLAFFTDERYRASHPTAVSGHPLGGAGFLGATLGVTLWQTPVYEASTKLVVGQRPGYSPKCLELPARNAPVGARRPCYSGWELLIFNHDLPLLILPAVADAIDKRPVAEEVIQRLGLRMKPAELVENLSVEQEGSTVFFQLSYRDTDPARAQRIVNAVGAVSSERIPEKIGADDIVVTM
jgi:hypothetical protein